MLMVMEMLRKALSPRCAESVAWCRLVGASAACSALARAQPPPTRSRSSIITQALINAAPKYAGDAEAVKTLLASGASFSHHHACSEQNTACFVLVAQGLPLVQLI
jgi:pyruvate-formate lyase